jgi:hypothetical protein
MLVSAVVVTVGASVSWAGQAINVAGPVRAGQTNGQASGNPALNFPAIPISLSGQTAFSAFTTSPGFSTLQPGTSVSLTFWSLSFSGSTVSRVVSNPVTFSAPASGASVNVQLASRNFTLADTGIDYSSGAPIVQRQSAFRVEWHEQGSAQGFYDLINDQIGYTGGYTGTPISNVASRGPSSSNATWINGSKLTSGTSSNGQSIDGGNYGNTYDTAALNPNPANAVYDAATGFNRKNGQNRVQVAIGEYRTENLSRQDTAQTVGSVFAKPGSDGYGLGNSKLPAASNFLGLGNGGGRQQFFPTSIANQSTDKIDPQSTTGSVYSAGPWNTAGFDNIDSIQYGVTAVTFAANPGTGIYRINKGDAQYLQTLGRLRNGADFNVVSRGNDAGQRTVPALSVDIDPSWAVGENDDGNTSGTAATNAQKTLGSTFRFSGKTAGGESRAAIAQSRLGFGPLSLLEARGAASNAPVRALDVDFDNLFDPSNPAQSNFRRVNFDNIVNFDYKGVLISHYNVVKAPRPDLLATFRTTFNTANGRAPTNAEESAWWASLTSNDTGIKGDVYGNVKAFIGNITGSIGTAASGLSNTPDSINNPADALFANGFLIPGILNYKRQYDGGPLTPSNLTQDQLDLQQTVKANYSPLFTTDSTAGSNNQTKGSSATYGALNPSGSPTINTAIPITAFNADGSVANNGVTNAPKGNYLFGNFNQNGIRDFSAVKASVNAALSLTKAELAASASNTNSIYTGLTNNTAIASADGSTPAWTSTAGTKGDLIVLGDFNSDGQFDGKDIYLLARGTALSDQGSDTISTTTGLGFSDKLRDPRLRLNKNAALDYASAQTAPTGDGALDPARLQLRRTASPNLANDPNGLNAFNKRDVNRDGLITPDDAFAVDKQAGLDYQNLQDSLNSTIATDGSADSSKPQRILSLVDAKLVDVNPAIDGNPDSIASAAVRKIQQADVDEFNTTPVSGSSLTGTVNAYQWRNSSKTGNLRIKFAPTNGSTAVTVSNASTFSITAGTFQAEGTNAFGNGSVKLRVQNDSAGTTAGTTTYGGLAITGGSHILGAVDNSSGAAATAGGTTITGAGTTLQVDSIRQQSLTVSAGAKLTIAPSPSVLSVLSSLSLTGSGSLDLTNNTLILHNGDAAALAPLVRSWWNNGARNGPGLGSSALALGLPNASYTTLALFPNTVYSWPAGGGPYLPSAGGFSLASSDLIIRYTYVGDINLDGQVDGRDFKQWFESFIVGGQTGWRGGDFNYDGVVDLTDLQLLQSSLNASLTLPSLGYPSDQSASTASIPEPSFFLSGVLSATPGCQPALGSSLGGFLRPRCPASPEGKTGGGSPCASR